MNTKRQRIIALSGSSDVGKSTTIKRVHHLIKNEYKNKMKYLLEDNESNDNDEDIKVVFSIYGINIGIASGGDSEEQVRDNINFFTDNRCKLIICATKSWGKTVEVIEKKRGEYEILYYCNRWMKDENPRSEENETKAQRILFRAKEFIENERAR